MCKLIAWNVNSLLNIRKIDMDELLTKHNPDILCFSETKLANGLSNQELMEKLPVLYKEFPNYQYHNMCKIRKGYSGTSIFSKIEPISINYGLPDNQDKEGRVITLEFAEYYLVHVYTPNSGRKLARLDYRINTWDPLFWGYIEKLKELKPVIIAGDLNIVSENIDIHNPKVNKKSAGVTVEERNSFHTQVQRLGFIDSFRHIHSQEPNKYTFWSSFGTSRIQNKGWRLDYFMVDKIISPNIIKADILNDVLGSDHCPILLELKL
ncbi:exodeoxyribonuclease III [Nitrosopumilus sp.]|nr:exodeoxyribonuclease III [Nitrosopumilus sp.]